MSFHHLGGGGGGGGRTGGEKSVGIVVKKPHEGKNTRRKPESAKIGRNREKGWKEGAKNVRTNESVDVVILIFHQKKKKLCIPKVSSGKKKREKHKRGGEGKSRMGIWRNWGIHGGRSLKGKCSTVRNGGKVIVSHHGQGQKGGE